MLQKGGENSRGNNKCKVLQSEQHIISYKDLNTSPLYNPPPEKLEWYFSSLVKKVLCPEKRLYVCDEEHLRNKGHSLRS